MAAIGEKCFRKANSPILPSMPSSLISCHSQIDVQTNMAWEQDCEGLPLKVEVAYSD